RSMEPRTAPRRQADDQVARRRRARTAPHDAERRGASEQLVEPPAREPARRLVPVVVRPDLDAVAPLGQAGEDEAPAGEPDAERIAIRPPLDIRAQQSGSAATRPRLDDDVGP